MTGFEVYQTYFALRLHFTSPSYSYFRYNGKTNHSIEAYQRHKDKYRFEKLSRKYQNKTELEDFIVSNWLEADITWVGQLSEEEARDVYLAWQTRVQSLSYRFAEDCDRLAKEPVDSFGGLFRQLTMSELPPVVRLLQWRDICPETFVIINKILGFFPLFDRKLVDSLGQWKNICSRCTKYEPFVDRLSPDLPKLKAILREKLQEKQLAASGK